MRFITIIFLIALVFSCTEQKEILPKIEGVWKRSGTLVFENGKIKDTLAPFYNFKTESTLVGYQYKVFSSKYFGWIRRIGKDTNELKKNIGLAASGNYVVRNDSLIETIDILPDRLSDRKGRTFEFKIEFFENSYMQYAIDEDGSGRGELYKRIDDFKETNLYSGAFNRAGGVKFENYIPTDTTFVVENINDPNYFSQRLILTDNHYFVLFNQFIPDSSGADTFDLRALLAKSEYSDSIQSLTFLAGLKNIEEEWKTRFNYNVTRYVDMSDKYLILGALGNNNNGKLDENGNGNRGIQRKIE
mgnify:CR=1 FL=1